MLKRIETRLATGRLGFWWRKCFDEDIPLSTIEFHFSWIAKRLLVRDIGDRVRHFGCLARPAYGHGLEQA
jgi:hypothetical protein